MRARGASPAAAAGAGTLPAKRRPRQVVYPESDGKPMGETPVHVAEIMRLILTLQAWFRNQPLVYVGGNNMFYWVEGNNRLSVSPDVYVVKGLAKDAHFRVYQVWQHGPPSVVIEVTSGKTRKKDRETKYALYEQLGVREYILYDPLGDWVEAGLTGHRLNAEGRYGPLPAAPQGGLLSRELGLRLVLEHGRIQCCDPTSGERVLSAPERAELERQRAEAEQQRADAERARAEAAEERAQAEGDALRRAQAEIAELQALLQERRPPAP